MEITNPEESLDKGKLEKKKGKKIVQFERNRTAFERLQLAWIRSCLTLMMIGVGAYEYFYNRLEAGKAPLLKHVSGRELGMLMTFIAFIMLVLSTIQHNRKMALLKKQYPDMEYSIASWLSYLLIVITFFLTCMIIFR
jgi:uncharacterized membrane protein YidH (DUF202 family)